MSIQQRFFKVISVVAVLAISLGALQPVSAQSGDEGGRRRVSTQRDGDGVKRQFNPASGRVSFIGPENGRALPANKALGLSMRPQDPGKALARRFGPEFGLKDPDRELVQVEKKQKPNGQVTVKYQQQYENVPVMGGELIVNTNGNGDLYSINGEIVPELSLSTQPGIDAVRAQEAALQGMAEWYQKTPGDFVSMDPELWIYDESLLKTSTRPVELVWRMEVTAKDAGLPVRELVLVNAQNGSISLHFNQVDTAWMQSQHNQENDSLLDSDICPITTGDPSGFYRFQPYTLYDCFHPNGWMIEQHSIGTGDFNHDGRKDVALSVYKNTPSESHLLIFLQDNNGHLQQPVSYSFDDNLSGSYLTVGDLNNDSYDDVITYGGGTLRVYLQNSVGTLNTPVKYATIAPDAMAVGDINGDGRDDIVLSHWGQNTISVLTQKDDGSLDSAVSYPSVGYGYGDIAIGDINSDGLNDVVKMNGQGGFADSLIVYIQNNGHTLNSYTTGYTSTLCSNCEANGLAIGDVTGDGKEDVVLSYNNIYTGGTSKIAVFKQDANGDLQSPISYSSYEIPVPVEVADINFDNLLDVVTLHSDRAGVYLQQNNGVLGTESHFPVLGNSFTSHSLAISDINSDGNQDILVASSIGLMILYQRPLLINGGNRHTYSAGNILSPSLPGQFLCDQTVSFCAESNSDANAAHYYAGGTWNLFHDKYGRNSIDNNGMTVISTVDYGYGSAFENAYWSGTQMIYGDGFPLADDVVAHELTHGVTEYESDLFYYYQSGAINESLSDMFGEYYDQTNGQGNDTANVMWFLGEDLPWEAYIRSMSDPTIYGDPDRMGSPYYYTGMDDYGGVHWNSGVNNKAVYLMVNGDTFNGKTITGIGWDKVGAIYYEVNTNLLTSAADYSDLYFALQQACTNLVGQQGITDGDCTQVRNALDAVEMNRRQAFGGIQDPGFEYYTPNPYWEEYSDQFGTPLCTVVECGNSSGTAGPRTGSVWSWFGGTTNNESAYLSQTVYFPDGYPSSKLKFYLWIGRANAGSDADDRFIVDVDGVPVFTANATQKSLYSSYKEISVDLSSLSTNALHTITFSSVTSGQVVNFNLDDVSLNGTFADVPLDHMFWKEIEAFYRAGITTGCSQNPLKFCPYANVTRAEMAVFIERAMGNFTPTPNPTGMFTDVPSDFWASKFIDEYYNDGITTGCANNPLRYCPNNYVTRQEMAVFIERALGNFAPNPNPTGMFADVPYPGMPSTFPAFTEQFYNDGITTGCAVNPLRYCPLNNVTRQEMAVFIVRAFHIPLP